MLLAWPLPGGGRLPSIAFAKLMHLPTLQVLGVALATFLFTASVTMLAIHALRHQKVAPTLQRTILAIKRFRQSHNLLRSRPVRFLLGRLTKTETSYLSGQRSTKVLLAQLPWCPGGIFSSVSLIHKWKLPKLTSLPIVLLSGWTSFVVYYFAASLSLYVLAAVLIIPFVVRVMRRHFWAPTSVPY